MFVNNLVTCPSFGIINCKSTFQAKGNKFEKLSAKEKRTLLARILEEEFVNPIQVSRSLMRTTFDPHKIFQQKSLHFYSLEFDTSIELWLFPYGCLSRLCGKCISMCQLAGLSAQSTYSAWSTTGDTHYPALVWFL